MAPPIKTTTTKTIKRSTVHPEKKDYDVLKTETRDRNYLEGLSCFATRTSIRLTKWGGELAKCITQIVILFLANFPHISSVG